MRLTFNNAIFLQFLGSLFEYLNWNVLFVPWFKFLKFLTHSVLTSFDTLFPNIRSIIFASHAIRMVSDFLVLSFLLSKTPVGKNETLGAVFTLIVNNSNLLIPLINYISNIIFLNNVFHDELFSPEFFEVRGILHSI